MLKVGSIIQWKSYKIEGKWYEGTIIKVDKKGTKRRKNPEYHIKTALTGIHSVVVRTKIDIRKSR